MSPSIHTPTPRSAQRTWLKRVECGIAPSPFGCDGKPLSPVDANPVAAQRLWLEQAEGRACKVGPVAASTGQPDVDDSVVRSVALIMDESEDESSVCRALIKVLQLGVVGWASYSRPITSDTNPLTGACDPLLAHSLGQRLIPLLDPMPRIYVGICGALGLSGGWLPCSSMLTRC
jgi:hypothetical protein